MSAPTVFRWEQCYEVEGEMHWALRDSATDAEVAAEGGFDRVSSAHMVLLHSCHKCLDGRPLPEQELPALIVHLLNEHFAKGGTES